MNGPASDKSSFWGQNRIGLFEMDPIGFFIRDPLARIPRTNPPHESLAQIPRTDPSHESLARIPRTNPSHEIFLATAATRMSAT